MSGRAPRFISVIRNVRVTLEGALNSNYSYVTIRGTKYYNAAELKIPKDSTISVYVGMTKTSAGSKCAVTLNGETVKSGYGTYDYFAAAGAKHTLTFKRTRTYDSSGDIAYYYTCAITTS